MAQPRIYCTHRDRDHDYSAPGWTYVQLHTKNHVDVFGYMEGSTLVENDCAQILREIVDVHIPERYSQMYIDAYRVWPEAVQILIRATKYHNEANSTHFLKYRDWRKYRRGMTVPVVVSYLKTHTAQRINAMRGTPGRPVWTERYGDRYDIDEETAATIRRILCGIPDEDVQVGVAPVMNTHRMVLPRADVPGTAVRGVDFPTTGQSDESAPGAAQETRLGSGADTMHLQILALQSSYPRVQRSQGKRMYPYTIDRDTTPSSDTDTSASDPDKTNTPTPDPDVTDSPSQDPDVADTPALDPIVANTPAADPDLADTPALDLLQARSNKRIRNTRRKVA